MMRKKPMLAYPVNNKPIDYSKPVFMQNSRKPVESSEEKLLGELASLMTQLNLHQEKEEYEKCAEIKKQIEILKKKLNNR